MGGSRSRLESTRVKTEGARSVVRRGRAKRLGIVVRSALPIRLGIDRTLARWGLREARGVIGGSAGKGRERVGWTEDLGAWAETDDPTTMRVRL